MDEAATYTIEVRGELNAVLAAAAHKAFRDPANQASAMLEDALRNAARNAARAPRTPSRRPSVQRAA